MHEEQGSWTSLGLLFLRVLSGGMMLLGHGWAKLAGFAEMAPNFPDPLGLGSSTFSLGLAVFAEALEAQHDPPVAEALEAEQPEALAVTNFTSPDASAFAAATSASGRVMPEATLASIHESRVSSEPVMTLAWVVLADWHLA